MVHGKTQTSRALGEEAGITGQKGTRITSPHGPTTPRPVCPRPSDSYGPADPMHQGRRVVVPGAASVLVRVRTTHVHRGRGRVALLLHPALAQRVLVHVWRKADGLWAKDPRVAARVRPAFGAACCGRRDVLLLIEAPVPDAGAVQVCVHLRPTSVGRCGPRVAIVAQRVDGLACGCCRDSFDCVCACAATSKAAALACIRAREQECQDACCPPQVHRAHCELCLRGEIFHDTGSRTSGASTS